MEQTGLGSRIDDQPSPLEFFTRSAVKAAGNENKEIRQ